MRTLAITSVLSFVLAACGGTPEPKPEPKPEPPKVEEKAPEPAPTVAKVELGKDDGGEYPEVSVESDGDQMAYKQTSFTMKADTPTRIRMVNNATSPAMKHNIVIVKKGSEDAVGKASMGVPEAEGYVPAHADVLAATKLAGPGETTTTVLSLPAGEYAYICTFPGHYILMKGTITVE